MSDEGVSKALPAVQSLSPDVDVQASGFDFPPPPRWRRAVPRWLRTLIWLDSAPRYDGFLSYNWKSDRAVAASIQTVLQRFLCPWYRLRARAIFRDLASLPAESNLEQALQERLDRSTHLIVLACPDAAQSSGMEMEASYWFAHERKGSVIVVVTAGDFADSAELVRDLLPPTLRRKLSEPIWVDVRPQRARIIDNPLDPGLRGELTEQLKQLLLCLYPGKDWGDLQGEERRQRRRALSLMSTSALTLLVLVCALAVLWKTSEQNRDLAVARQLAAQSELLGQQRPELLQRALLLGLESVRRFEVAGVASVEADQSVRHASGLLPIPLSSMNVPVGIIPHILLSADGLSLATQTGDAILVFNVLEGMEVAEISRGDPQGFIDPYAQLKRCSAQSICVQRARDGGYELLLVNMADGKQVGQVAMANAANAMAATEDGRYVAAAAGPGDDVTVWTTATGDIATRIPNPARAAVLAFDRSGSVLVVSGRQYFAAGSAPAGVYGFLSVVDVGTWQRRQGWQGQELATPFVVSAEGRTVSFSTVEPQTGGGVRGVRWVDLVTLETKNRELGTDVAALAYDEANDRLAIGGWDRVARVWNVRNDHELRVQGDGIVTMLSFLAGGEQLMIGTRSSNVVRVWQLDGGVELARIVHEKPVIAASAEQGGVRILSVDEGGGVRVSRVSTGDIGQVRLPKEVEAVGFDATGSRLAFTTTDATVHLMNTSDWTEAAPSMDAGRVPPTGISYSRSNTRALSFSPDGRYLAAFTSWGFDPNVDVWDLEQRTRIAIVSVPLVHSDLPFAKPPPLQAITLSKDARWLGVSSSTEAIVFDIARNVPLARLRDERGFTDLAFSRDGALLAVCSRSGVLSVRQSQSPLEQVSSLTHTAPLHRLVFAPDGKTLAAASEDNLAVVWHVGGNDPPLALHHDQPVSDMAFSPDGRHLATACDDGYVRVWDLASGDVVSAIEHGSPMTAVGFVDGGRRLISGGAFVVRGPGGPVLHASHYVRKWFWTSEDLRSAGCEHLSRNLTATEWATYLPDETCARTCAKLPTGCEE